MVKLTDNPDASTTARQKGSVSLVWYLPMCVRPAPGPYGARLKLRDPASVRERTHVEYASSSGDANVAEAASDPIGAGVHGFDARCEHLRERGAERGSGGDGDGLIVVARRVHARHAWGTVLGDHDGDPELAV